MKTVILQQDTPSIFNDKYSLNNLKHLIKSSDIDLILLGLIKRDDGLFYLSNESLNLINNAIKNYDKIYFRASLSFILNYKYHRLFQKYQLYNLIDYSIEKCAFFDFKLKPTRTLSDYFLNYQFIQLNKENLNQSFNGYFIKPVVDLKFFHSGIKCNPQQTLQEYLIKNINVTQYKDYLLNNIHPYLFDEKYLNHIIVSPAIHQSLFKHEFRTVVKNKQILSVSRYLTHCIDNGTYLDVYNEDKNTNLIEKMQYLLDDLFSHLICPNFDDNQLYTFDFMQMKNNELKLIEINCFNSSGLYNINYHKIFSN